MDDSGLGHVPSHLRERFCAMLCKDVSMWDGSLSEIKAANRQIDLVPGTRPIVQAPYRTGHNAREKGDRFLNPMGRNAFA